MCGFVSLSTKLSVSMELTHTRSMLLSYRNQSVDLQKKLCTGILQDSWQKCIHNTVKHTGAVVPRCSVEKVFLEISQNSQENICARISFFKKGTLAQVVNFLRNLFFYRRPTMAASRLLHFLDTVKLYICFVVVGWR